MTDILSQQKPQASTTVTTPAAESVGSTAVIGTATDYARGDHTHAMPSSGTPSTQAFGDAAAPGSGPTINYSDHKHAMPANPVPAYATWTLTNITQNAVNLTFTPTYARSAQHGKTLLVQGYWTITQVGTAANGITLTVPAGLTPANVIGGAHLGTFTYARASGPVWTGNIYESGTSTIWSLTAGGGLTFLGTSPSFATANGDILTINCCYEVP